MTTIINPLSSINYAPATIAAPLTATPASGAQAQAPAVSGTSVATAQLAPLRSGGAAAASMQAISQLSQGGYGEAGGGASPAAAGAAGWYAGQDASTSVAGTTQSDAGAAVAAGQGLAGADAASSTASPMSILTDRAFSARLAAASNSSTPLASIKALAQLAGQMRTGAALAPVGLDAAPGSPGAKVYEALQELAKGDDKYIGAAAQSLMSRIGGVASNGTVAYEGSFRGSPAAMGGKAARALSDFADEAILGLARHMAAGSRDAGAMQAVVSGQLRAVENGSAIVMPTSLMPRLSLGSGGMHGPSAVAVPANSVFLDNGSLVAIFPGHASAAPWRWYQQSV